MPSWKAHDGTRGEAISDRYVVVLEGDEASNFSAYCPDVLGCVATGATVEQTIKRMREALWLHLGAMRHDGERVPESRHRLGDPVEYPDTVVGMVEVTPKPIRGFTGHSGRGVAHLAVSTPPLDQ